MSALLGSNCLGNGGNIPRGPLLSAFFWIAVALAPEAYASVLVPAEYVPVPILLEMVMQTSTVSVKEWAW